MNNLEYIKKYLAEGDPIIPNAEKHEDYNPNSCRVIGITGSYAKTSSCYLLYSYLITQGFRVSLSSSGFTCYPSAGEQETIGNGVCLGPNILAHHLAQAIEDESDYFIVECHEDAIVNEVFDELDFHLKALSAFSYDNNEHRDSEQYLQNKLHFFNNGYAERCLINYDSEKFDDFVNAVSGIGRKHYFSFTPTEKAEVRLTVCCKEESLDIERSRFKYTAFDSEVFECSTDLSMRIGVKESILLIAYLCALGLYKTDEVHSFLYNYAIVPGRCEDFQWNGRYFVIDSGSKQFLKKYFDELKECNYQPPHYKVLYGLDGGGNPYKWEQNRQDATYLHTDTKIKGDDSKIKKESLLSLGANIASLVFGKENLRDHAVEFDKILPFIGDENIIDFKGQTRYSQELLDRFYEDMCANADEDLTTRFPDQIAIRMWNSSTSLKTYFTTRYEVLEELVEFFKSYGNHTLNERLEFVCSMIFNVRNRALNSMNVINELPLDKVYFAPVDENFNSTTARIANYKQFCNFPHDWDVNRKVMIKKMIEESEPGDMLFFLGRGNNKTYRKYYNIGRADGNPDLEYWTDREYIEEVIQELETNNNN